MSLVHQLPFFPPLFPVPSLLPPKPHLPPLSPPKLQWHHTATPSFPIPPHLTPPTPTHPSHTPAAQWSLSWFDSFRQDFVSGNRRRTRALLPRVIKASLATRGLSSAPRHLWQHQNGFLCFNHTETVNRFRLFNCCIKERGEFSILLMGGISQKIFVLFQLRTYFVFSLMHSFISKSFHTISEISFLTIAIVHLNCPLPLPHIFCVFATSLYIFLFRLSSVFVSRFFFVFFLLLVIDTAVNLSFLHLLFLFRSCLKS